ncbi:hypothetical protein ACS0TY_013924 [Phlomoides rotata]
MYELYCAHAQSVGFGIRKSTCIFPKDGKNVLKEYDITRKKKGKKENWCYENKLQGTNEGKITEDGKYEVAKHIVAIREGKVTVIIELTLSGIRPTDSYRYLAHSAGGED